MDCRSGRSRDVVGWVGRANSVFKTARRRAKIEGTVSNFFFSEKRKEKDEEEEDKVWEKKQSKEKAKQRKEKRREESKKEAFFVSWLFVTFSDFFSDFAEKKKIKRRENILVF